MGYPMKKIISLLGLALFSTASLAGSLLSPSILSVNIKNDTPNDCVLKQQFVLFGHVSDHTKIPEVIFRDQTATFLMRSNSTCVTDPADICTKVALLVYACGDDKEVALYSKIDFGKVVYAKNMHADFRAEPPPFLPVSKPGIWKDYWTLKD